jgi:hypothetical protein
MLTKDENLCVNPINSLWSDDRKRTFPDILQPFPPGAMMLDSMFRMIGGLVSIPVTIWNL